MARTLNKKEIEGRVKANKQTMRNAKATITDFMNKAMKNERTVVDASAARKELSAFIKAADAVKADSQKLASIEA